ncbi:LysR family transcriptional regulator [Chryseobacterium pennipullorum]|uniref:LysR family transcriptional regulator n=1 Tax=Chryseobacterium pennipullorum TaxID=2258963 RepID=A0A3D9BAT6_9FLAO|nr:LysR family transcriptional regulator [Chryseobacterium pennipullorum]REC50392.1 LysR family transcriptional regulator [Chryseobacterium pennipullorum]
MDIQQIRYFLVLAKELHFWNTAGKVNITQSALSRQIKALEEELGIMLFERNKRNVKLTPAGTFLYEKWAQVLNELDFFNEHARQIQLGEVGTLIISHPDSLSASFLPDVLSRISSSYPGLKIELLQVRYEEQEEFLRNYKVDLAITRDLTIAEDIASEKMYSDHLAIVVPENHPFRSVEDITPEALKLQKFILPGKGEGSSYIGLIQQLFRYFEVSPDASFYSEFGSAIIALVRNGLGIAVLPDSYAFHESPGIRFIPTHFQSGLYLNWRKDDHHPVLSNILNVILSHYKSGRDLGEQ